MDDRFFRFKKYAEFILHEHIDDLIKLAIVKAKELDLPILKYLHHLSEEEFFQVSKEGFRRDVLLPIIEGAPFENIKSGIENWKKDAILIPKEQLVILDITQIHNVRKAAMFDFLRYYPYTKEEGIELIKEIEFFFTTCINLGLEAYEEIQRGELKEKNEILTGILSNIPMIVTRVDKEGVITQSLGAGLHLLGARDNDYRGTNVFHNYPDADNIKTALGGQAVSFIGSAKNVDGTLRHYQNYFFPESKGALGFSLDITEGFLAQQDLYHKKEELKKLNLELEEKVNRRTQQLVKQKEYLLSVLMQAPAAIAILKGPDLIYELSTPLFYKIIGRNDLIGKPAREAVPELAAQGIWKVLEQVQNTGTPFHGDEFHVRLDRSGNGQLEDCYFNLVVTPLRSDEGIIEGIMLHATDITTQVESTILAKDNAKRVFDVLESIPAMAWTANAKGEVTYFSSRWCSYTNQSFEQALGSGWENVLHPDDIERTWNEWKKSLVSGELYEVENRVKKASDGNYYWFLVRGIPIKNSAGEVLEWVGTCLDIHEIKLLQQKSIEASKELASLNEELTATNEELSESNFKLNRINADLDNFIYTASHDLKAPISNIEGLMSALIKKLPIEISSEVSIAKIITMIEASIYRFKNTIVDLTEISKLQKEAAGEVEEIDIKTLVDDVKLDLEQLIKDLNAEVIIDLDTCNSITYSYKNLRSIVYNLLSNGIKYSSPERKPVVRISTRQADAYCLLTVEDNGLGLTESQKEKMFTMFKRFHTHVEGTGVGLYIVKRIVENFGGKIEVETELGKGTTFRVFLNINEQKRPSVK